MEFLGDLNVVGKTEHDKIRFERKWTEYLKSFQSVPKEGKHCDAILAIFTTRARVFLETRHRMYTNFNESLRTFEAVDIEFEHIKKRNRKYSRDLESAMQFFARDWMKTSNLWPVFYMDVMPAFETDNNGLFNYMCEKLELIENKEQAWINLPPRINCKNRPDMLIELNQFVKKLVQDIKDYHCRLNVAEDATATIKFIFDSRRSITKLRLRPGEIHPFNLMYKYFEWSTLDYRYKNYKSNEDRKKYKQAASVNFKIINWIIYDVIADVITESNCNLTIYLADSHAMSISWLFVKMGAALCNKNIQFEFNDPVDDPKYGYSLPQPAGENSTISDIMSIEAFYFIHHHEIYRANSTALSFMDTPQEPGAVKSIINNMTEAKSPLYFKLKKIKDDVFATIKMNPVEETPDDAEYNICLVRSLTEVDKVTPTGAKITMLIAAPGTGKTTYVNTLNNCAKFPRDDIMQAIRLGGKTVHDYSVEKRAQLEQMINATDIDLKTKLVLINTFWVPIRKLILAPAESYCNKIRIQTINNLLEKNYNIIIDNVGELTIPTYMGLKVNKCGEFVGEINFPDYHNEWIGKNYEIVLIYLGYIQTYNQQVLRYYKEQRLSRLYSWIYFYYKIWRYKYTAEYIARITIVAYDLKNKAFTIAKQGKFDRSAWKEYLIHGEPDNTFINFLKINYNVEL